ncbi:protein FAM117A isoform X4 [Tympanuchus pallidicinctus]|uniref:protein FAM117A isoform X4 n=1 Tax=Tympanuchus pallidicinctus TaxID=109042 RepID=UPI002286EF16|nr:protein FAM117A isoform X4 [Tympanuchus pallidicinctus]
MLAGLLTISRMLLEERSRQAEVFSQTSCGGCRYSETHHGCMLQLPAVLPHRREDPRLPLHFVFTSSAASVPCAAAAAEKPCRPRQPRVRRTFSLDTIVGSYLLGQWPRDADGASASCMNDKATQIAKLKQQLQRTKLNGRSGKEKEKSSPLQGDHAVLGSLRDSPSGFLSLSPVLRLSPCLHRSLEGLNQELEEVFVKEHGDEELLRILDVPDGHRAPAPAPRGSGDASLMLEPSSGSCSSLSLSPSPSVPLRLSPHTPVRLVAEELSSAVDEMQLDPKEKEEGSPSPVLAFASSPRPNHSYMFKREPPEGCEKVRAFEEASSSPDHTFQPSCPDKNKVHFNPTGSAFCPVSLVKPLFPNVGFLFSRGFPASSSPGTGTFTSCQPSAPTPFLGARKDAAVDNFSDASKSPSLNYEHWKRGQPEENVVFHSSLVV